MRIFQEASQGYEDPTIEQPNHIIPARRICTSNVSEEEMLARLDRARPHSGETGLESAILA